MYTSLFPLPVCCTHHPHPLPPPKNNNNNNNNNSTEAADGGKTAYATLTNLTLGGDQSTNKYYGRLRFYLEAAPGQSAGSNECSD